MLHVYGHDDNYTPPITSRFFAAATGAHIANNGELGGQFDSFDGHDVVLADLPIEGNSDAGMTGVTVQHKPDLKTCKSDVDCKASSTKCVSGQCLGYDGHFVAFRKERCLNQIGVFVKTMIDGETPVVPPGD